MIIESFTVTQFYTESTLLIPYPMDNATFVYVLSSPVYVNNKHWGALKLGIKI